jgi:anti-sigma factor RsiW
MKCRDFVEFLVDYEDGALPTEVLVVFEEHMRRCPPCLTYLKTYRLTIHIGRHACRCGDTSSEGEVPEPLVQAILAACRRAT